MMDLKEKLQKRLKNGEKITLKWDCGGDEALVYTSVNGKELSYSEDLSSELDMHILNLLELPSAGEFSMEGKGEIVEENGKLVLQCESTSKGYYDDEVGDWVEDEDDILGSMYSGKYELFDQ